VIRVIHHYESICLLTVPGGTAFRLGETLAIADKKTAAAQYLTDCTETGRKPLAAYLDESATSTQPLNQNRMLHRAHASWSASLMVNGRHEMYVESRNGLYEGRTQSSTGMTTASF
jgi:hypothetical protein